MMVACRSRSLLSRSAAATVSSVDWPLTCNTRAKVRTRSDRSCNVITAHPKPCSQEWRRPPYPKPADRRKTEQAAIPPLSESSRLKVAEPSGSACHIGIHHLSWIDDPRSEEHTSELQSLAYLVCRLLLE